MQELWKPVAGYEAIYEVSNLGQVRSLDRLVTHSNGSVTRRAGRTLVQCLRAGYPFVNLQDHGRKRMVHTHRLVAEAFCDPVDGCNVVNHLDGSRDNNVWTNLEWTTFKGNTQHAVRTGLMVAARGESSGGSTLTGGQVDEIRRRIILGENGTALGKEFGVKPMCISDIKNGKTWAKHGDPELVRRCKETDQFVAKGSSHAKSKITEKDVERIIVMLKARVLQKDIAREIGCHEMTVCRINLGKVWVHVRVDGCGEPPYFILKPRAHHLAALSISL